MRGAKEREATGDRRPLASRGTAWAQALARGLLRTPATPNGISATGILFAALGGIAFAFAPEYPWLFLAGALLVQLRLLCNLLDGMVAVEGGRGSPTGALFNEIPDRLEDSFLLIGFGYAAGLPELGFVAALLAVLTAYLRAFGASLGLGQDFGGPMAKPQRMAALTLGGVASLGEIALFQTLHVPLVVLAVVVAGTAWTCVRRIARMARALEGGR
ncbi:CDP-alcohol phosphatidyltransferase family protein [Aureimonas populi]|uniref:CDP-alcohol phosphatidyltransferase family protein n=1 Tax=Aureimonas populi TaxID=1701758 RepID=A0ABW5CIA5_9HYPH|nr:CDP-alcohol phosphatidyltransferase family protein [Aureimonas populi]